VDAVAIDREIDVAEQVGIGNLRRRPDGASAASAVLATANASKVMSCARMRLTRRQSA